LIIDTEVSYFGTMEVRVPCTVYVTIKKCIYLSSACVL